MRKRQWLLAAAVILPLLAACTTTAARPGPGRGQGAGAAGSCPGMAGLRAVRHVWLIDLQNQGYAQSFGTPSMDPYLARTLPRMGPCWRTTTR